MRRALFIAICATVVWLGTGCTALDRDYFRNHIAFSPATVEQTGHGSRPFQTPIHPVSFVPQ